MWMNVEIWSTTITLWHFMKNEKSLGLENLDRVEVGIVLGLVKATNP